MATSPMPETLFRHALDHDEFRLAYQPIVDLRTRRQIGVEALIRWPGADVGPDIFIPIAEQIGLIREITQRVCDLAARDCRAVPTAISQLSINLSAADIQAADTVDMLRALQDTTGGRLRLSVELTERSLLDPERCGPVIKALRAMDIQVVIDDFGTGYANLQALLMLELDGIKIDRSLSQRIGTSPAASLVIHHLCALARALGLSIVAEGVETETQAGLLYGQGIRRAQGWLFGHPQPIEHWAGMRRPAHSGRSTAPADPPFRIGGGADMPPGVFRRAAP